MPALDHEGAMLALEAAIDRAVSRAPVSLRALLVCSGHGGGENAVWHLAQRLLVELGSHRFSAIMKVGEPRHELRDIADILTVSLLSVGWTPLSELAAGGSAARKAVAAAILEEMGLREVGMTSRIAA